MRHASSFIGQRSATARDGFTIVELLIVIVVIAILAALVLTAYRGVQDRASDAATQTDFRNFTAKLLVFHANNGRYPYPTVVSEFTGLGVKFSPSTLTATAPAANNMLYCGNPTTGAGFAVIGQSKTGTKYISTSDRPSTQVYTGVFGGGSATCAAQSADYTSWRWGVDTTGTQGF